ncbi:TetR/AcrR family transcriptional regulator [Nocardia flavorosea]|uniref:TetR/AcrR family transcriptional regulator n=1 Tax=Nocardia flavorosea TaxID=53429 RepID=UPI00189631E4|nr:TetR/AcrR family transcriptional regulator [Nocardia flavorosea]MBF6351470.1 TetR/AcrR family transcriptional regulator [Nocardia flavorosea]
MPTPDGRRAFPDPRSDGVRRSPRQDRSRFTVDTLLEAAAQLFGRDGLATTTNHIAERAGTSIGTLYQYFPDKQAILHALARRHVTEAAERLGAVFDELRATEPPFETTLRAVLDVVAELHRDRPGLHALMHRIALREAGELAAVHAFEDHLANELAYHLRRCRRGGPDPALTARILMHTIDAQVHRVHPRHPLTTDDLVAMVEQLAPPVSAP